MTLQCADWTQRRLSGDKDCWKLSLQWKPFWPDWVRPTDVCGWWLGGKQNSKWVSSILLWIRFHPSRGGGFGECVTLAGSDVTQAKPIADRQTRLDPCPRTCSTSLDPSLAVAAEMDTKQFQRLSERLSYPRHLEYELNAAEISSTNHIPNCHPLQITIRFFSVALKPQCLYPLGALNPFLYPLPPHLSCSCLYLAVLTVFSNTPKNTHSLLSLDYLLKPTRTVTWPSGAATLSVTNLWCRVLK